MCRNELDTVDYSDRTSDKGFMGITHSISGLAILLALVAFVPAFSAWAGISGVALIALAALVVAGSALISDLDNTASTARSTLGIFGVVVGVVFRATSEFAQRTIRTRRDDKDPNPHRGLWHTIPAALFLGGLTLFLTTLPGELTLPLFGKTTVGWVAALVISLFAVQLAFAGLFGKAFKKMKKETFGDVAVLGVSLVVTLGLFWFIPRGEDFWWLGVAVALGVAAHILGDAFTTAGVPILFPLSYFIHKKFWWNTRFTSMKAGGAVENYFFIPFFVLVILVSLVKLVLDFTGAAQ